MSASIVDLFLIVLIVVFAINGYRQGFVVGLLSFVGFFGGAAIGLQLGPWLAGFTTSNVARVFIALATVFGLAIGGSGDRRLDRLPDPGRDPEPQRPAGR